MSFWDGFKKKAPIPDGVYHVGADWAEPARNFKPKFEALSKGHTYVDVDKNEQLAGRLKVRGVPAVVVVKNGKVVDTLVGDHDEEVVQAFLSKHR